VIIYNEIYSLWAAETKVMKNLYLD